MPRSSLPAVVLSLLASLAFATPAFAQDGGVTTWFQAFLVSEDLLGMIIIWSLIFASTISIGYAIYLFMTIRRSRLVPDDVADEIENLLSEKKYREAIELAESDDSFLGRVLSSGLNEAGAGFGAMERAVEESGDAETSRMLRPVEYLNVLGNIAPMLGLFGTVYGMILAFQTLVAEGGKPDAAKLAAGISTALVTTFWGLIVAMPALATYALIRNRIDALTAEGLIVAEDLIRPFKPGAKRTSSRSSSGGSTPSGPPSDEPAEEDAGEPNDEKPRSRPKPKPDPGA